VKTRVISLLVTHILNYLALVTKNRRKSD